MWSSSGFILYLCLLTVNQIHFANVSFLWATCRITEFAPPLTLVKVASIRVVVKGVAYITFHWWYIFPSDWYSTARIAGYCKTITWWAKARISPNQLAKLPFFFGDLSRAVPLLKKFGVTARCEQLATCSYPLDTWRCCDVESASMTLIQRRNNVVCQVGRTNN